MLASHRRFRSAGGLMRAAVLLVAVAVAGATAGCNDSETSEDQEPRQSDRRGSLQRNGDDYNYPRLLLRSRSMAQALKDRAEIAGLLRALNIYADSYNGKYPPSLDALAEDEPSVRKMLTYKDGQKRFEYVAGLSRNSQRDSVIVYEAEVDQDKKRFVGRVNGAVELLDEEQFAAATER